MDLVSVVIPITEVKDGDNFTATAYFRDRETGEASAPTTVEFRIDCLTTKTVVQDWTSAVAGESVSIALSSTYNTLVRETSKTEVKQITVTGDRGETFQCSGQGRWTVRSLGLTP